MEVSMYVHLDLDVVVSAIWGRDPCPHQGEHSLTLKKGAEYSSLVLFLNDANLRELHRALSERVALLPVQAPVLEPAAGGGGALAAMSTREMP